MTANDKDLLARAAGVIAGLSRCDSNVELIAELLQASLDGLIDRKVAARIIDEFAAGADPWQDCRHSRCIRIRALADVQRGRMGLVRDPKLVTLRAANIAVSELFTQARRGEDIEDAAVKLIAQIQHAIDNGAFDSVALAHEIEFAQQAIAGRV